MASSSCDRLSTASSQPAERLESLRNTSSNTSAAVSTSYCADISSSAHDRYTHCTPETSVVTRSVASRRLCYVTVPPMPPLQPLFQTSPQKAGPSTSDDLQSAIKVIQGQKGSTTTPRFTDDQIDCICEVLTRSKDLEHLASFLRYLTVDELRRDSEPLYKARALAAFNASDYQQLFRLLESRRYSEKSHAELQALWFDGHYAVAQATRHGRPLRAVDRYRVRRRYPAPSTIWDGQQTVYCIKEGCRQALKDLYTATKYPTTGDKRHLATTTGLTLTQIGNWFKNRRQRSKSPDDGHRKTTASESATQSVTERQSTTSTADCSTTSHQQNSLHLPRTLPNATVLCTDYRHLLMAMDVYMGCS